MVDCDIGVRRQRPSFTCLADPDDGGSRWERATALLAEIWLVGLKPDSYSYSSAIHACAGAGRWIEALSLLQVRLTDTA